MLRPAERDLNAEIDRLKLSLHCCPRRLEGTGAQVLTVHRRAFAGG
jgi:hypothetical protein